MAAGDVPAAAARFLAVAQSSPTAHQACLAAVAAALALLATGQWEDVSKAADVLRHHHLFESLDGGLPYAERYIAKVLMLHCKNSCCTAASRSASSVIRRLSLAYNAFADLVVAVLMDGVYIVHPHYC